MAQQPGGAEWSAGFRTTVIQFVGRVSRGMTLQRNVFPAVVVLPLPVTIGCTPFSAADGSGDAGEMVRTRKFVEFQHFLKKTVRFRTSISTNTMAEVRTRTP